MITIDDLKRSLGTKSNLLLTNLDDSDITVLITEQTNIIMDILNDVPDPIPQLLKKICSDFCKYELYQMEARQDVPEAIERQYNNALKQLYKINKREITFDEEETDDQDAISFNVKPTYFGNSL